MNKLKLIESIKKEAEKDQIKRDDLRFKKALAFLVKKGFLTTNLNVQNYYQARIRVKDLIWAGKNVEPRILEVLPAAVARLPKSFIFEKTSEIVQLQQVAESLKENQETGYDFLNIPYIKIKQWMNIQLKDRRTKANNTKKILKTFRFSPKTIQKIEILKHKTGLNETALLENLIDLSS